MELNANPEYLLGNTTHFAADSQLRPLRGDLLNDEITTSKELEDV